MMETWVRAAILILIIGGVIMLGLMKYFTIVTLSLGGSMILLGATLLFMEAGPAFWYWWVGFGFGYCIRMNYDSLVEHKAEISKWLDTNMALSVTYRNIGDDYYFLRKTDAIGFKLVWAEYTNE